MSYKTYSMELAGRTLSIDIGRVAKQANGAALMHYGFNYYFDLCIYVFNRNVCCEFYECCD